MTTRVLILGFVATAGLVCVAGCETKAPAVTKQPPPEVVVSKPVARKVTDFFEFPGRTAAVGDVEIRARVSGYLVKVNFVDGQLVKKGDLLYEIDPRPYQAALDKAKGELVRLQALLVKAESDMQRAEHLRPSGAISQENYDLTLSQRAVAKASIQSAEAAVRDAELNLEFTRIASPIDGRVSRTRITEGNLVQPGGGPDAVLTTVVTIDPVYAYFNIDERALLQYAEQALQSGESLHPDRVDALRIPVEIGLANEKGFPHVGTLDFTDNKVDANTGTIRARGVFQNANDYLRPGLYVRVRIPFGKPHQALLVSERAIGRDQRDKFLLTVNKDNVVESHKVEVGSLQDGLREIVSGINPDDWVVVRGLQRARPGVTVIPHPETSPTSTPAVVDKQSPALAQQAGKSDRQAAKN